MLENFKTKKPKCPSDWMRALCRILAYREHATKNISSEVCEDIAIECFGFVKHQIRADREAKIIYRHGSLCIAYLLRRRRYDPKYMDPVADFGRRVKAFFEKTIEDMNNNRVRCLGGFVNLPRVTQIIVDYIDRRGKERLLID